MTVMQSAGSVVIEPAAATLMSLGETVQLTASVLDQNGQPVAGAVVDWQSSDASVATVSSQGLVTAVGNGSATVTARTGSASANVEIMVTDDRTDRAGLTAFYNATDGPNWGNNDNWLSDGPLEAWYGVTTNVVGRVTSLVLKENGLSGSIPVELSNLDSLHKLDLYRNRISGPIPPELGSFENLQYLSLWNNELSGPIPPELGSFENLQYLYLAGNELSGPIPPELGNLENLQYLELGGNELSGSIPPVLGNLKNLQELNLGSNELSGPIPPALGSLENLQGLYLDNNELSGSIPPELGNLANLRRLHLSRNRLSGQIPPALGSLENLQGLYLDNNELSGSIPPELGNLANLRRLHLSRNRLSGQIPPALGNLKSLRILSLSHNRELTGPLPPALIQTKPESLEMESTDLCIPSTPAFQKWLSGISTKRGAVFCDSGTLIALYRATDGASWSNDENWLSDAPLYEWYGVSVGAGGRVRALELANNNMTGSLPSQLSDLANLEVLNLSSNSGLIGPVPHSFTSIGLLELELEGTQLCAPVDTQFQEWLDGIPQQKVMNCTEMRRDYYPLAALYNSTNGPNWTNSTNWLSDSRLDEWHGVATNSSGEVTGLSLAANNLLGVLPPDIGQLIKLNRLSLGGNQLTGSIPPELGQLYNLTVLYLGENRLTGSIPPKLGQLHNLATLFLGGNQLTGSIPPELGQLQNLTELSLGGNQLTGSIPPELGQLHNLENLNLNFTRLTGSIPPELVQLGALEKLGIQGTSISGPIPTEIGQLGNLEWLGLDFNQLSGPIPTEIGQLGNLKTLQLSKNQLSGPIPLEIGQLGNLEILHLTNNQLTGPVPSEIGQLGNLVILQLSNNQLSGPIPLEISQLGNLERLWLANNQLTGLIPPELGQLGNLEQLRLSYNRIRGNIPRTFGGLVGLKSLGLTDNADMSGVLPPTLTNLDLEELLLGGTQLCAPSDPGFQDWLRGIPNNRVADCGVGGGGSAAYVTQATQSLAYPVPLMAGEDALLRVFITSESDPDAALPPVRATFYERGAEVYAVDIPGSGTTIPRQIEEGDLSATANARIPGRVLAPGLEMVVEIDPDGGLDPALGISGRLPREGRMPVDVVNLPPFELTLIPFLWTEHPDESYLAQIDGLNAESDLFRLTRDILPVGDFVLNVHEPVSISVDPVWENRSEVFRLTGVIATMEGGAGHYMGMLRNGGGRGELPGNVTISGLSGFTIAHELGHNLNLFHAPCGDAGGPDPEYPYPDGSIGAWGYDLLEGRLVDPSTPDLMGYCDPAWISDYNFNKAMGYRLSQTRETRMAAAFAPSTRSLLLWGGVNSDGDIVLEPAFAIDAPASMPRLDGPYRIVGEDEGGGALFSLRFGMAEIADGEGGSFAFVIPVRLDWSSRLSRIVLSGPEGVATLGGEESEYDGDDRSAALLLDPVDGRVRGLLRNWTAPSTGLQTARRALPEPGLEVVVSWGVPDLSDWNR